LIGDTAGMPSAYRPADIASAYAPRRTHYWYARCKLASDPLYLGVGDALRGVEAPLLDLGCGVGLLVHTLRAQGLMMAYHGLDNDAVKIDVARRAATRAGFAQVRFERLDLSADRLPIHLGSVALLDVLQFLAPAAATRLIERAAACVAPGARLVIRSGLQDAGVRARITRTVDSFSRRVGWMNAAPKAYPTQSGLKSLLANFGLRASFSPLYGRMPFNNWLIVGERA
jgi:SAM-dependent methyltransferase